MIIDLRSDTVTKPTPAMRQAMLDAEVGDDVYREDPTVNLLEQRSAEIVGKEAALFVPTGTMGNTIAIKIHTEHGQEVICEARSHILDWELSMTAWFSSGTNSTRTLATVRPMPVILDLRISSTTTGCCHRRPSPTFEISRRRMEGRWSDSC